ncbi:lipid A deacylase LpxR family protein [Sediminicoccus sp. KRV36]|uniref:lipid A deacylase LpxR family protein n=1 Tax=Sediminicoccus sp. KRV36 TaxID=3133721 RepID=UPI00200ED054|nr:lipid A deacylase LpxR family protein [Sediminicoccus rosea]UPY38541.1 lipid A deacylase LpxR family protein [Sediminicoccus rosea]
MPIRPFGATLLLLLASLTPAVAQTGGAEPRAAEATAARKADPAGSFSVSYDNDLFAGTDRYYTSGLQFDWRSASENPPGWLAWLNNRPGNFLFPQGGAPRWGLSAGQNIFTPSDTQRRNPDPQDRPYAGWLYGAVSLVSSTATEFGGLELQVGVVGPSALGRQAQNGVHRLRNLDRANGWSYQLKDEVGVNLILSRQWRFNQEVGVGGLSVGMVPSLTGSLGNVLTYASAGLVLRLGNNLTADFGPPRNRPAISGSAFFEPGEGFSWYVFAGIEGRAVARNIFLDGNSLQDSRSVERIPGVADASVGAVLMLSRARLTASYTFRSREFSTQPEAAQYGSISLSVRF